MASPQIPLQIPRKQLHSQNWLPLPTLLINQLGKYSPQISSLSKPLRELLSTQHIWSWKPNQEDAFDRVKAEMATPRVFGYVQPNGLYQDLIAWPGGLVLFQQTTQGWCTAVDASRSMTDAET